MDIFQTLIEVDTAQFYTLKLFLVLPENGRRSNFDDSPSN